MATSVPATSSSFPDPVGNWESSAVTMLLPFLASKPAGNLHQCCLLGGEIPFLGAVWDRAG